MMQVSSAVASHPGLRREENEDSYCVRPDLGLYMVADGMGGHAAGEVASKLAVDAVEGFVDDTRTADINRTWPFPFDRSLSLEGNRLSAALKLANRRIGGAVAKNESLRGMATTAAVVLVSQGRLVIAHVGDSRVYLMRDGQLQQLTMDHSWVSEQVRAGVMTEADARRHPWRNVVTRALAGGDDPEVEIAEHDARDGDLIVVCSDGLSSVVTLESIAALLAHASSLESACQSLVEAANQAGGPDNITVAILRTHVE